MAQINVVARTLIRIIFGTSLMNGTYQEALQFYRTAAELSPSRVIHRVEVGRTLLKCVPWFLAFRLGGSTVFANIL